MLRSDEIVDKSLVLDQESRPLVEGRLLMKSLEEVKGGKSWKFRGIASDESPDVTGDEILRKSLDLSYAQQRGYVNWDHSRAPEDQLGFLTHVEILGGGKLAELQKSMGVKISDTASVYLEGELYKYVRRAQDVYALLKSAMEAGNMAGPGMSLDGVLARDKESGGIVRAFMRGVAISSVPAHPKTMCMLMKSLQSYSESNTDGERAQDLMLRTQKLAKSGMSPDEAILWLLRRRPNWSYEFATQVVNYTIAKQNL